MADANDKDAIEHYQVQVPGMHVRFAKRLRDLRKHFEKSGELFTHNYPTAVTDLVVAEIGERTELAAESMTDGIDAGWRPTEDELQSAFIACFNPSDYRKDSFCDLKDAVTQFTNDLGRTPNRQVDDAFQGRIGQARSDAAVEAIAKIKMHLKKAKARERIPVVKLDAAVPATNDDAASLAVRLIQSYLTADRPSLSNEVRNVLEDCAGRGVGHSGAMVAAVEKTIVNRIRKRVDEAVHCIEQAVMAKGASLTSEQMAVIYDSQDDSIMADATKLLIDAASIMGPGVADERKKAMHSLKDQLREAAHARLKLVSGGAASSSGAKNKGEMSTRRVFVTHGRDKAKRDAVMSFLYGLKLEPVVLEDKPNAGMTIIEKYEEYSKGGAYGIAILSPDDVGCLKEEAPAGLKPRARQNVIFELGYMFANISRHRVAVLLVDDQIERPTNIDGIAWIYMDPHDGWHGKLEKELRNAKVPLGDDK